MFKTHKTLKIIGLIAGILVTLLLVFIIDQIILSRHDKDAENPANNQPTNYQNDLSLNWKPIVWNQTNGGDPNADFPKISQNENVYMTENISYAVRNGQNLALDLYSLEAPKTGDTKPIVVYIHGGGMIGGTKNQLDAAVSDVMLGLVNNGFIVASINYEEAPAAKFPAQIQDVLMAMRFVRYYAYGIGGDQNKIGILGDSVGGQLAALAGVTNGLASWENSTDLQLAGTNLTAEEVQKIPSRPNAVADFYGGAQLPPKILIEVMKLFHIGNYYDPFSGNTYQMAQIYQMIYNDNSTLLHEGSPAYYVAADEPPFLIAQGDKDTLSPPSMTKAFYNKLKSAGNDVTLVWVKNADHRFLPSPEGATIDPSFESVVNTTISFFKNHL